GATLVAVEPVAGMRRTFVEAVPDVPIVAGLAEAMPFRDGSLHAVTVAQAFHWFDAHKALRELHRVIRPGGGLGLVWNIRDGEATELARGFSELFDEYRRDVPAWRDRGWEPAFRDTELFTSPRTETFDHVQEMTPEVFLDRALSVSFIAALPPAEQQTVRDRVLALVPAGATTVSLPYRCEVSWCERR
ncbi:MAG: class I SAM-dependent methyltransferase, partial [Actinomycetota bacterium]